MKAPSLKSHFRKLSIRWSLVAFALTLALSIGFFSYFSQQMEKKKITTLSESVTRAFRVMILDRNFRDAQMQIKRVLNLKDNEVAIIRGPDFKAYYSPTSEDMPAICNTPQSVCSASGGYITYLEPVYFDDDLKENLFGYVELRLKTETDWILFGFFAALLISIFSAFVVGISSTQNDVISLIRNTMESWAKHLIESPTNEAPKSKAAIFEELAPLEGAISELHLQIEKLKEKTASEERFKTQLSMIREIGHDLKTPFSQLAKLFVVHLSKVEKTGRADEELTQKMQRSMNSIGDIIRQVQSLGSEIKINDPKELVTDIQLESKTFIEDFIFASEMTLENKGQILFNSANGSNFHAKIPKIQFYRILDNFLRNALDAVNGKLPKIEISVFNIHGRPTLEVKDNGRGIEESLLDKIFDAEFTTKPVRGTGLGLSIVKRICEENNAIVEVGSKLGTGTTFRVIFNADVLYKQNQMSQEMQATI